MSDFLSQFHKSSLQATTTQKGGVGKTRVLFRLSFERGALVTVVNEKGEPVDPDYKLYQGETFNVLRILYNIRREQAMRISWETEIFSGIRLHDYPYLVFALLRCNNLVDAELKPLRVSEAPATIVLQITNGEKSQCQPALYARAEGLSHSLSIC